MEKYSQFRDRGSGISPFLPISTPASLIWTLIYTVIFCFRLPFFLAYFAFYFIFVPWLPHAARKVLLFGLLGISGVYWADLQLDGVKRGSLSAHPDRVPRPRAVIAANFTSPIDAVYLTAVFDPVFTVSYPGTRKVRVVTLWTAMLRAFWLEPDAPPPSSRARLTDLRAVLDKYPGRLVAVFPEGATSNGRGLLPFGPSLLAAPPDVPIHPVSIRYTPPDLTTPIPGSYLRFLWTLLSRPKHYIRVRIADSVHNTARATNGLADGADPAASSVDGAEDSDVTGEEQRVLDKVGEALARLGRSPRVGLTLRDKVAFVQAWSKGRR